LVTWSFLAGNLKIVLFRTASGKISKTLAGLGLEQRFFLNESLNNKLYEFEAIFEQLFSEKKLLYELSKMYLRFFLIKLPCCTFHFIRSPLQLT
jgi:hypothetical protein